jgi:putative RecB family exonuclease
MTLSTVTVPTTTRGAATPTGRDYISYTALSTYVSCPLRYYFRYVAGLPEETVSSSLVFGQAIHRALECHSRALRLGQPAPARAELVAAYETAWTERSGPAVQFGAKENREALDRLAGRLLETFQQDSFARPSGRIVAVEEELRGEVVPGCPDLLARLDLVVETAEGLLLSDVKTARARWSAEQAEQAGMQLLLYHELIRPRTRGQPIKLEFAVLTKTKVPELILLPVPVDVHRLERARRIVGRVWEAITDGHFYPSPGPLQCGSCPYREACRDWV